jgi:hypothetical protein
MVGAPWINEDMTKLFYEIVSKGKSWGLSENQLN